MWVAVLCIHVALSVSIIFAPADARSRIVSKCMIFSSTNATYIYVLPSSKNFGFKIHHGTKQQSIVFSVWLMKSSESRIFNPTPHPHLFTIQIRVVSPWLCSPIIRAFTISIRHKCWSCWLSSRNMNRSCSFHLLYVGRWPEAGIRIGCR